MDQPTIYSETVREKVGAFGVRRSAFGVPGTQRVVVRSETLKTGAADLQKETILSPGRVFRPCRSPVRVNRRRC
jgi:hypothetical protein